MLTSSGFFKDVLARIARRYALKGQLSGTMKVGMGLESANLQELHNFFGVEPIRISRNNEVRIDFDRALQHGKESFWLERIGQSLGTPLQREKRPNRGESEKILLSKLQLAFPKLQKLTSHLEANPGELLKVFARWSDRETIDACFQLAKTVEYLLTNTSFVTISELGSLFFKSSKILRQGDVRKALLQWLRVYSQHAGQVDNEDRFLEQFSVYHDRLTINAVVYGPVIYSKNGIEFDWIYRLYQQGEPATLSWVNLQDVESMRWQGREADPPKLICCENEAPFSQLVRQLPENAILFTCGFPNSAVRKIYQFLAPHASSCCHWGDTDPNGLRIAAILASLFPLCLYRCDADTIRKHADHLLPLTEKQRMAALEILKDDTFPFREELNISLKKGWLEQESWLPDDYIFSRH
jgi:Wadjet protein JetD, C-terminal